MSLQSQLGKHPAIRTALGEACVGTLKHPLEGATIRLSAHRGPGSVVEIAPGHDAWTVGGDPCVLIDFGETLAS